MATENTTETTTTTKSLISAKLTARIRILGCPERGLEALAWRRERGLPERLDDNHDVTLDRPITEEECARLLAVGAKCTYYTSGRARVNFDELPQEYDPLTSSSYGHWATIEVAKDDSDIALVVRALASCRQQYEAHKVEMTASEAKEKERKASDEAERRDALLAVLPRILAGEGKIERYQVTLDGTTYYRDQAGSEVAKQINDEESRREKVVTDERDEWVRQHGSSRLQKALAAGMVDKMGGVYLDERIAHDLGAGWSNWQYAPESKANDRLNAEEDELNALVEARTKWPDCNARLRSVGGQDDDGYEYHWRPALLLACPWDKDETAIRYLD